MTTDYERGWRDALEAAAKMFGTQPLQRWLGASARDAVRALTPQRPETPRRVAVPGGERDPRPGCGVVYEVICHHKQPCLIHAAAPEEKAPEPRCGALMLDGQDCTMPLPCFLHKEPAHPRGPIDSGRPGFEGMSDALRAELAKAVDHKEADKARAFLDRHSGRPPPVPTKNWLGMCSYCKTRWGHYEDCPSLQPPTPLQAASAEPPKPTAEPTQQEREAWRSLSDSPVCQACGVRWEHHGYECRAPSPKEKPE